MLPQSDVEGLDFLTHVFHGLAYPYQTLVKIFCDNPILSLFEEVFSLVEAAVPNRPSVSCLMINFLWSIGSGTVREPM